MGQGVSLLLLMVSFLTKAVVFFKLKSKRLKKLSSGWLSGLSVFCSEVTFLSDTVPKFPDEA
jgi:hypothetical protein